MRLGLCCICLALEDLERPLSFQTMTYKSFSSMERKRALGVLGGRILNNMETTLAALRYCGERNLCYRLSSDLFPLVTYEPAGVGLDDLPQVGRIHMAMDDIRSFLCESGVRVSTHPDQFNVLASENEEALERTVRELNFQSWFMDRIGCPADRNSPINLHINSNRGSRDSVVDRLLRGMDRLDEDCRNRIVFENDDKASSWSVRLLLVHMYKKTGVPVTFDFLHHKCHPDGFSEGDALALCHATWGSTTPLFHYSESREGKNPRAHADFPSEKPRTYGLDFDLDFEFKMKDRAIDLYESALVETPA
jgi:UV DNA damage endonuclease